MYPKLLSGSYFSELSIVAARLLIEEYNLGPSKLNGLVCLMTVDTLGGLSEVPCLFLCSETQCISFNAYVFSERLEAGHFSGAE